MTPKEKAIELVDKFVRYTPKEFKYEYAKQCALICIDQRINERALLSYYDDCDYQNKRLKHLNKVKQEIENL